MIKLRTKIFFFYSVLMLINTALFTILIFENQLDLSVDLIRYETEQKIIPVYRYLFSRFSELQYTDSISDSVLINTISDLVASVELKDKSLIVYKESGEVLYQKKLHKDAIDFHRPHTLQAIKNRDFYGVPYLSVIDEAKSLVYYYIPFEIQFNESIIMVIEFPVRDVRGSLYSIYKLTFFIIFLIIIFHLVFAFILIKIILLPLRKLTETSHALREGYYSTRIRINRQDEIGQLGSAFNEMAISIEHSISELEDKNRILNDEIKVAKEVQSAIYPSAIMHPVCKICAATSPLEPVNGDFYDFYPTDNEHVAVLLCDVIGHGIPAALVTMFIKELGSRYIKTSRDPAHFLANLNTEFIHSLGELTAPVTAFFILIEKRKVLFCNAGHNEAIYIGHDATTCEFLSTEGGSLGIQKSINAFYENGTHDFAKGDRIILYTDGIIESRNNENNSFGLTRFCDTLLRHREKTEMSYIEAIRGDFYDFLAGRKPEDDFSLVVIEF